MKSHNILVVGICIMMLITVFSSGCAGGQVEKEQPALIGLERLDTNDELNIVNWTVQGTHGDPKLSSFDWELKENNTKLVWSGVAVKYAEVPENAGVYYVDANDNDIIDIGDIFRVKATEDGEFTLYWIQRSSGNQGQYESHY